MMVIFRAMMVSWKLKSAIRGTMKLNEETGPLPLSIVTLSLSAFLSIAFHSLKNRK